MKTFLSLVLLFISFPCWTCSFRKEVTKVISLSGTMTVLLRETGLLEDQKLTGISVFNPIDEKKYQKKVYPGGLFIAQSVLPEFNNAVVFYDGGEQIRKILSRDKSIKGEEISTRMLLPLESVDLVIKKVSPYVSACEKEFISFKMKAEALQEELLKSVTKNWKVIFYLGEIKASRYPELVIANDGVVKLLRDKKLVTTYPSELAYVNWSARILSTLPKATLHVGVFDPGMKFEKKIKRSSRGMTLVYPGSLVPGYSQLEAFHFLIKSL